MLYWAVAICSPDYLIHPMGDPDPDPDYIGQSCHHGLSSKSKCQNYPNKYNRT